MNWQIRPYFQKFDYIFFKLHWGAKSVPSHTPVEVVALDSSEKKRPRSESLDRPAKRFKSRPFRDGSSSQATLTSAQPSITGSTTSAVKVQSNVSPEGVNSDAGTTVSNSTTKVNSTGQQLKHHYRDPVRIPGENKNGSYVYVFPHAKECISLSHKIRFPVIIDIFKQNLHEYSEMALKHPAMTEYELKMCGTSMNTAKPSILIYHPETDEKTGQKIIRLLSRPHIRQQYRLNPCFDIYWFSGPEFSYFGRPMDSLSIRIQDSYIPGALLSVMLVIGFDDQNSERDTEHEGTVAGTSPALNEDEDEERNRDILRFGAVEYDLSELRKYDSMDKQDELPQVIRQHTGPPGNAHDQSEGFMDTSEAKVVINPNRAWGRSQGPEWNNDPNLDWALVEIGKSEQWEADKIDLAMHDVPGLGYQSRDVQVVTSRGPLYGTISSIPSFIANSNNLGSLCKVWAVSLVDSSQMSVGDSGALVIDSITKKPYGYVIGINYFQELYVIPLEPVLEQISQMMPASNGNPEIFMGLVSSPVPGPLTRDRKYSRLTRRLSRYWPRTQAHNVNASFYETPWLEDDLFDTTK
ncbi:hypothetical protein TrVFT333_011716 [Trichoderma virens FT-333]|nr:hypothetical protein TrVFT333_011716 [Trichoderma virens FT-333]